MGAVGSVPAVDVANDLREMSRSRDLFVNLTLRELRGKYKRSVLGWGWSLLNPLATMIIFTAVFAVLLRAEPDPGDPSGLDVFALFLLCGLLPWNYLSNGMNGGMGTLVGNANLIKKVYFARQRGEGAGEGVGVGADPGPRPDQRRGVHPDSHRSRA